MTRFCPSTQPSSRRACVKASKRGEVEMMAREPRARNPRRRACPPGCASKARGVKMTIRVTRNLTGLRHIGLSSHWSPPCRVPETHRRPATVCLGQPQRAVSNAPSSSMPSGSAYIGHASYYGRVNAEKGKRDEEYERCHWSTSFAWNKTVGGMVRPRALAALRLMTRSNVVGCSIGRSAGLVPFRILST